MDGGTPSDVIELAGVSRAFGTDPSARVQALDDVTVRIASGGLTALTGPSGSGKSTLLHVLASIEPVDSGSIRVAGEEITRLFSERWLTQYRECTSRAAPSPS